MYGMEKKENSRDDDASFPRAFSISLKAGAYVSAIIS